MSAILSLGMGSAATVTDFTGAVVEIEDEFKTMFSLASKTDNSWETVDDRVMGGKSYSWCDLENGYGKFYGTASSDGGGFSYCSQTNFTDSDLVTDFSGYDGLAIEVASQEARTLKFTLVDDKTRFPPQVWDAYFEVPGGMQYTTIYIPFQSFLPDFIGFPTYQSKYLFFWDQLDVTKIKSMQYKYSLFIPYNG